MPSEPDHAVSPEFQSRFRASLEEALGLLGMSFNADILDRFGRFADLLLSANARTNLTSITAPEDAAVKHFADSLSVLKLPIAEGANIIDVGAGGGFPGVPLAIARPDLEVVLLDATLKKIGFLKESIEELGLGRCKAVCGRAESLGRERPFRESFDAAVWRGLGDLRVSAELCMPLVRTGGIGIAMKGPKLDEELEQARSMLGQLGCSPELTVDVALPRGIQHRLLVLRKNRSTPPIYPRPWAKIRG